MAAGSDRPALLGRDDVVARLAASRAPLTILTGDSGIGKSDVLAAAQAAAGGAIAPPPRTLPASGGVLQRVLLEGLGAVLAEHIERSGQAKEASRHLIDAVERLLQQHGQELLRLIGQEVLAVVRARLGPELGAATAGYITSLKETVDQRLSVRLNNALDRSAAELVLELAGEVIEHIQGGHGVLALDAGERLPESDVRVLADLVVALPAGLRLRMAVATYSGEQRATVEYLRNVGPAVAEIPLEGVDERAVAEWLAAEGVSAGLAAEVTRVTGGYPLHVGDLIAHLSAGGAIDDAPLHEAFARRTAEAWAALEPEIASHARKLCVFSDPLPIDRALELLSIDATTWGEVQERLSRARIFSVTVNALPWFHEQRRRYISEIKLGAEERGIVSAAAVELLENTMSESEGQDRIGELAELAACATPLLEASEQLRAAVGLDETQLALCASLVELIEPNMALPVIGGDELLRYAKKVFGARGDLIAAFRGLDDCPFVHVDEQGDAAVAVPHWESTLIVLVIGGRSARELGRSPVPAAAGSIFASEIQPRIVPFLGAGYGVGDADMARLGQEALEHRRLLAAPRFVGGRDTGPDLLLRGRYAGRAIYAHVCFEKEEQQAAALARLVNHHAEVFGERFEVIDVLAHPLEPVPAKRFLLAAQRLLESQLRLDHEGIKGQRVLHNPIDSQERMTTRAAVRQIIRDRCDPLERYALGLDQSVGLFFYGTDDHLETAEIIGGAEEVRQSPEPLGIMTNDPFRVFRIENLAGVQPFQRVGRMQMRSSRVPILDDPAVEALNDYAARAKDFNAVQRRLDLRLDAEDLQHRLEAALARRLEDAEALRDSGVFGAGHEEPRPLSYSVELVANREETGHLIVGPFWSGQAVIEPHDGSTEQVTVRISDDAFTGDLRELDRDGVISWTRGDATGVVAELLGHRDDDVRFMVEIDPRP